MNFKSLRNPDLYHGRIGKHYFEGWYFKLVDADMENVFAFIPGVFYSPNPRHSHAFIQVVDGRNMTYSYEKFPADSFSARKNSFEINIDGNVFSKDGVALNMDHSGAKLEGNLQFTNHQKWPDSFINPGSMGFYNYILKMQCYSQVCSMDFDLQGSLQVNGRQILFDGGRGYIEKNWGSSFPYSWVWVQCNHFDSARASLSCSLAHIPFLFTSFRGFLIGLCANDTFYKFTTMNGSKIQVFQSGSDVTVLTTNDIARLKIVCETERDKFILLNGPRNDQMIPLVQENLQGKVYVELKNKSDDKILFQGNGSCAGVEYGGEQMMVLDN